MIGQGRPKASRATSALPRRATAWLCGVALACLVCLATCHAVAADATMQLRVAWGGGAERVWQGSIRLTGGQFSQLQPLGIEADEPGSIWLEQDSIEIRQRSLRAYDGVDVMVSADLDARLVVSLANSQAEPVKPVEITLRSLVAQSHNSPLDDVGNHLVVARSPSDRLRVTFDRDGLVFSPGETFQFQIQPYMLDAGTSVRFQTKITTSPGGERKSAADYESGEEGTETSISLKVPDAEGVYDLSIVAVPSRRRALRLKKSSLAERKVQFIVLDKRPPKEGDPAPLSKVLEINPMNPRWWERLGNLPLMPGLRKGPLGNGDAAPWEHPKLGPMIQLGPGGTAPNISWEAYPLPITNVGQAHVLEIEYPSDVPQTMGISVLEPNPAGSVTPIGLDSGVYVADEDSDNPPQLIKHRLVFWPRTETPLLLITNRRQGSRAVYGKITVQSGSHAQFPMLGLGRTETGSVLPPAFVENQRPGRLLAGYLDRPLFVENLSAPEALDAISHRSLDDWNTFYQGGMRLVKYLRHIGYGGVMMSAFAEGSTIYPSQIVQPTPRYDTGVFFGTGQDPQRKDALELLFRLFDREGLTLIPALQFAAPLPELEALKRAGGSAAVGIEWIGADGAPLVATNPPRQGLAPYYNLLDPRVQEAMLKVAREVATRYAAHDAFGGLGLQLSAEGYAQLPGDDWGYDDQTIARFEREAATRVPGAGPERFAERGKHLTGPGRAAWVQWRAAAVADFHRRLQAEIGKQHEGAKLYLVGGTMLDNRQTQYRLRPTLPRRTKMDEALTELGIRPQVYNSTDGIVLLRTQHLRPTAGPLPAQAVDLEINMAPEMDKLFAGARQPGSLFYHEPQKARLASFDAKSPFGAANTYTWLVSQMSPSGQRNRRRFAHSLATLDAQVMFDGGWLLSLGQEDALRDMVSVYRSLPSEHFETLPGEFQPVTIRTLARKGQTYIYLVNDSPWDATVSMNLELPPDCKFEKLGEGRGLGPLTRTAGSTTWKVTLRPYDLAAARFSTSQFRVRKSEVVISEQVRRTLQRRIEDLGARVRALGTPQPTSALENAGFELPPQGDQIPGWIAAAGMEVTATLDSQQKHSGTQSLKLSSTGQSVRVLGAPFDPPATGRLSVEVWLRGTDPARQPSLRIAVEGQSRDGKFDPYGVIPAVGANAPTPGDWVRYIFSLDALPNDGLGSLRVQLELMGAGEVWVDDVQIYDLAFTETERKELSKMISLASLNLDQGKYADCALLLEGYWPQFLLANVPLTQTPLARKPRDGRTPASAPAPAKKPTVLENLKGYLPRLQK